MSNLRYSEPLLDASCNDIVAGFVQVFDGWVSLRHFVNLWVPSIVEGGCPCRAMRLIRSWLFWSFGHHSFSCIKSTLLKHFALTLGVFLGDFESVIETLSVQDSLSVLCKLISKQSSLLFLMDLTHVACLMYIGRRTSIEGPIVLVDFIVGRGFSAMESGLVRSEVGILTRTRFDAEALWGCLR